MKLCLVFWSWYSRFFGGSKGIQKDNHHLFKNRSAYCFFGGLCKGDPLKRRNLGVSFLGVGPPPPLAPVTGCFFALMDKKMNMATIEHSWLVEDGHGVPNFGILQVTVWGVNQGEVLFRLFQGWAQCPVKGSKKGRPMRTVCFARSRTGNRVHLIRATLCDARGFSEHLLVSVALD